MKINQIHFIREISVADYRGNLIPTMQFSYDNVSISNPSFLAVGTGDEVRLRELYGKLGGVRMEGDRNGTTVIIPNRPWYSSFWSTSPDEVQVVASAVSKGDST